ncbi:hypothetical protein NQ317_004199 [Molorchus minor]|uniref:Tyr recombinase domain-containing protein n=1 Tax=Molorchus minor TaxID=1323400 RepID=A0ABQ9IWD3_9CUCU|nr:hypothetical protein NQ317_004199 [Molorchus minor]
MAKPGMGETLHLSPDHPDGREIIRRAFISRGTPEEVIPVLLASLSETSIRQYSQCLKKWWSFCIEYSYNPFEYNITRILEYFTKIQKSKLSFSSLNTHRAALSLIFETNKNENADILKRFFKGAYNLNPPQPKYETTWDPEIVLKYIETLYPLENLTLETLSYKLVTLIALISASRMQTISKITIANIAATEKGIEIRVPERIKTSGPKKFQPILIFPEFKERPSLCIVKTLKYYMQRTQELRLHTEDKLLLTWKKPHHGASSETLSRWVKNTLAKSGIDISRFSSHSTRHASTSAALRAGVNIEVIRATAEPAGRKNQMPSQSFITDL